jgi:hypothetical protein
MFHLHVNIKKYEWCRVAFCNFVFLINVSSIHVVFIVIPLSRGYDDLVRDYVLATTSSNFKYISVFLLVKIYIYIFVW